MINYWLKSMSLLRFTARSADAAEDNGSSETSDSVVIVVTTIILTPSSVYFVLLLLYHQWRCDDIVSISAPQNS